jgi:RNA polymerase II subunit A small phosphatase-like protein
MFVRLVRVAGWRCTVSKLEPILLILDLDETLISAAVEPLPLSADFQVGPYFVYRRPHLADFLVGCAGMFRLAFWSSASDGYVQAVVGNVLPEGVEPVFVWGRSRCGRRFDPEEYEFSYLKDLKKVKRLGFDLDRVLIVDDTPAKLSRNYGNAVYISPWTGQADDDELVQLLRYLATLTELTKVRNLEKRGWRRRG